MYRTRDFPQKYQLSDPGVAYLQKELAVPLPQGSSSAGNIIISCLLFSVPGSMMNCSKRCTTGFHACRIHPPIHLSPIKTPSFVLDSGNRRRPGGALQIGKSIHELWRHRGEQVGMHELGRLARRRWWLQLACRARQRLER